MASRINRLSMALLFSPLKVLLNAFLISSGTLKFTVAIAFTLVEIFNNSLTHREVGKFPFSGQGDRVETGLQQTARIEVLQRLVGDLPWFDFATVLQLSEESRQSLRVGLYEAVLGDLIPYNYQSKLPTDGQLRTVDDVAILISLTI